MAFSRFGSVLLYTLFGQDGHLFLNHLVESPVASYRMSWTNDMDTQTLERKISK